MNIPFQVSYPRLVDPSWFNADNPCDEDTELTSLEQAHQEHLNSVCLSVINMKHPLLGKADAKPMEEEGDSDEEDGNESVDSEESNDEDEEEKLQAYSPPRNNNVLEPDSLEDPTEAPDLSTPDQSAFWPIQ